MKQVNKIVKPAPSTRVQRVDKAMADALIGENVDKLLAGLTADEQAMFYGLVNELRVSGEVNLEDLWKVDYVRQPPTMEEFISDPYWMGAVCQRSSDSEGLFPAWRDILIRDFDVDSRLHNVVITGSLGIGKTFIACLVTLYRVTLARLMRQPQSFLGLSKGSRILYVVLSVTKSAVAETAFGDCMNFMANSPFFLEECKYNPDRKYSNFSVNLGNSIYLTAGSKGWHILGRNTMGVTLDEGNWRIEANPNQKAYQLYDEVRTRIKNRFQKISGYLPAISILASSARDETAFTEQVIADINKTNDPNCEKVYRFSAFAIKRHTLRLSDSWFKVVYGLKNAEPYVLQGLYKEDGTPIEPESTHEAPPNGANVTLVPVDYLESFKRNVTSALQGICGVSTGRTHRLFSTTIDLENACQLGKAEGLLDPCELESIPLSMEDDHQLQDSLNHGRFVTRRMGSFVPLRDPDVQRYVHLDLATATQAGLAISHVSGRSLVRGVYDAQSGKSVDEYRLIVEYDFILSIVAGKNRPISLEKIQKFIMWLRDECGYRFGLVTADTFQSSLPLQMLEARGFKVKILSLDRTKGPYYMWRDGFMEGRIRMFRQKVMMREAEALLDLNDKIDHPSQGGSKDVADAAAGSYFDTISEVAHAAVSHQESVGLQPSSDVMEQEAPPISIVPKVDPQKRRKFVL
jgi:hypothetical protein